MVIPPILVPLVMIWSDSQQWHVEDWPWKLPKMGKSARGPLWSYCFGKQWSKCWKAFHQVWYQQPGNSRTGSRDCYWHSTPCTMSYMQWSCISRNLQSQSTSWSTMLLQHGKAMVILHIGFRHAKQTGSCDYSTLRTSIAIIPAWFLSLDHSKWSQHQALSATDSALWQTCWQGDWKDCGKSLPKTSTFPFSQVFNHMTCLFQPLGAVHRGKTHLCGQSGARSHTGPNVTETSWTSMFFCWLLDGDTVYHLERCQDDSSKSKFEKHWYWWCFFADDVMYIHYC